ncbi:MAG: VCBS repeat-containing protein [Planctomycetota bacterium]|nr:VCBS repeat-containing protein [Planctomycetota bacterium]
MGTIRRLPHLAFLWLAVAGPPSRLHALDCNQNGVEDAVEIEDGRSLDCNRNGVPDLCEILPGLVLNGALVTYDAGERPRVPRPADFDGDGDVDLAVMNQGGVSVLLNAGDASFPERRSFPLDRALRLVSGDFDRDGDTDLVVAGVSALALLLNDGSADFAPPLLFRVPRTPSSLASGDLDGDGDPDLAVGDSREVVVFANEGGTNLVEAGRHAAGTATWTWWLPGRRWNSSRCF